MLSRLPALTWPTSMLGPPPGATEVRLACASSIVYALLVAALVLVGGRDRAAAVGLGYDEDFVAFYGIGRLLDTHAPRTLYDFDVQRDVFLQVRPSDGFLTLPYVHAPFEAVMLRPFAGLPY